MRQLIAVLILAVCFTIGTAAAAPQAAQGQASIAGRWTGSVATDAGQMDITVVIKLEAGKATGTIETAHGDWAIKDGVLKDGVWTLPFIVAGEGGRWMKGKVDGDTFSGEWNNAPMAVGTFELTRTK